MRAMATEDITAAPSWNRMRADMVRIFAQGPQSGREDDAGDSEPAARIWVVGADGAYALSLDEFERWR